jgi:hypothetical protein
MNPLPVVSMWNRARNAAGLGEARRGWARLGEEQGGAFEIRFFVTARCGQPLIIEDSV